VESFGLKKNREINLDLMRFIGVLIIMIAHANPPGWLFQLRNFGTPLLIVASSLTYAVIYENRTLNYFTFIKKRLNRLIIPAWIFLTFFFCIFWLVSVVLEKEFPFSVNKILTSYSFYSGIGFVWILKVYIILAFFTPLALKAKKSSISNYGYFTILIFLYVTYEVVLKFSSPYIPENIIFFMNNVIFIIIPYSILYLYGMRLGSLSNIKICSVLLFSFFIFILLLSEKYQECRCYISTQQFKYPPTIYYISYAFFALNLVYLICRNLPKPNEKASKLIFWLSSNSLWIYLWHIMAFYLWEFSENYVLWKFSLQYEKADFFVFAIKSFFLLFFGMFFTYIQIILVTKFISSKHVFSRKVSYFLT
jgi:fucose 4-O-acetylase-like acetyltransferase